MTRYVAFLRAINVGGHVVKMHDLRRLFESIGFSNVETYIQSGNVIFDSTTRKAHGIERKIEEHLEQALGYQVDTFLRSLSEVAEIARAEPFGDFDAGARLYISFLRDKIESEPKQKLMALKDEFNDFHVEGRELYWLCRKSFKESAATSALIGKILKAPATVRNSTTVRKIAEKYC